MLLCIVYFMLCIFFFFSSRRRHTRSKRDWSSDVCSSDLDLDLDRGAEAVERVRELTGGYGAHSVLECVGLEQSELTAIEIARPGGAVGRVGDRKSVV